MRRILDFFINNYAFFLFIGLEALALFYTVSRNETKTERFISSANAVSGSYFEKIEGISQYFNLTRVNRELASENADLRKKLKAYKSYSRRSEDIVRESQYTYSMARVIKNSVNRKNNYITINKGKNDGVKENMAVVSPKGVVGIVAKVSDNYATVVSLLNTGLQITGVIKKNGYFGTVSWDARSPEHVILDDVPGHVDVLKGDTIVSSRYSSIFPEGLPIGVVERIFRIKQNNFYMMHIRTLADFRKLNFIYIIENRHKSERDSLEQLTEEQFRFTE